MSLPASAMKTRAGAIARLAPRIISTGIQELVFLNLRPQRFPQTPVLARQLSHFHPAPIPPLDSANFSALKAILRRPLRDPEPAPEAGDVCLARALPAYFPKYRSASRNNHNASIKCQ